MAPRAHGHRRRRAKHPAVIAAASILGVGALALTGIQAIASPASSHPRTADAAGPAPLTSAATAAKSAASAGAFVHPGVTVSKGELDVARTEVKANAEPWKSAYTQMTSSPYASLSRTPKPRATVECGSYSNPNNGCTDEREDAIAAYTDALAWYISGDARYAQKSIALMDAWSATIKSHTNSNAPLQTGWAGSSWPKAAEIIKYTYTGTWANSGRFATMLKNVYLPEVINGSNSNGNWELSMMEAAVGISVFLDDRTDYDKAMARFRTRTAAYVYISADGALPKTVPSQKLDTKAKIVSYWQGQSTFVDGITQETCRDFVHTGYGISAISHVAETSAIQGQDLYGTDIGERLRQALGFQSKYELGATPPSWLCGGTVHRGLGPVTETGFNALHTRRGVAMTNTQALTEKNRPAGTDNLFVAWETLTNANNPGSAAPVTPSAPATPTRTATPTATPTHTATPTAPPTTPSSGTGLSDAHKKDIAMQLVSSAENSSLNWKAQYGYIEDIGDGRGYTGGIIGFCSGTSDMLELVQAYTATEPGNPLAAYLPALKKVNGSASHTGLGDAFVSAWKTAAKDPVFQTAQNNERDRVYFDPAVDQAKADGLRALGQFIYYDAIVMHGPGDDGVSFGGIRKAAMKKAKTPAQGGNETTYLNAFLDARKAAMLTEAAHDDTSRVDTEQRVFLTNGNLDLDPPLSWKTYGDSYSIKA